MGTPHGTDTFQKLVLVHIFRKLLAMYFRFDRETNKEIINKLAWSLVN